MISRGVGVDVSDRRRAEKLRKPPKFLPYLRANSGRLRGRGIKPTRNFFGQLASASQLQPALAVRCQGSQSNVPTERPGRE